MNSPADEPRQPREILVRSKSSGAQRDDAHGPLMDVTRDGLAKHTFSSSCF